MALLYKDTQEDNISYRDQQNKCSMEEFKVINRRHARAICRRSHLSLTLTSPARHFVPSNNWPLQQRFMWVISPSSRARSKSTSCSPSVARSNASSWAFTPKRTHHADSALSSTSMTHCLYATTLTLCLKILHACGCRRLCEVCQRHSVRRPYHSL